MGRPIASSKTVPVRIHPDSAVDEDGQVGPEPAQPEVRARSARERIRSKRTSIHDGIPEIEPHVLPAA